MMEMTKEERLWVAKVNRALKECPSDRLGFYTTGDCDVTVYDRTKDGAIESIMERGWDFGGAAEEAEAVASFLRFPACVHSTAG